MPNIVTEMKSMKKNIVMAIFVTFAIVVAGWYLLNRSVTGFEEESRLFYIPSDSADAELVLQKLRKEKILKSTRVYEWLAKRKGYAKKVKPGRYRMTKGMNQVEVFTRLYKGDQEPLRFVINKVRTREDFARYAGKQLECLDTDILAFLNSPDSVARMGLDTNNAMTMIIPNTYAVFWNTPAHELLKRMGTERDRFWTAERKQKAADAGLTKEEVYIMASIIEEETNKHDEKPIMASVYINRLRKGMTLSADPTVKFALRNFGLKRILLTHINASAASPYNTYKNKGLPPGPICTPSIKTIDAVLNASETDYVFFCAKADFSGYHSFAANEKDHFSNARAYQKALDSLLVK